MVKFGLWDLRNPETPPTILSIERGVWDVAYSPDGQNAGRCWYR